ncbi:hypothetical protein [Bradyrhizobium japonicum]|uniref:hypothetical protein n=1 Tax=Bradyrhizobium japonicum TaxID=375 RepID=UPI00200C1A8C|nr:hypothetical protein [Bradyrhizobium japonicum]UQE03553.1 hypothetical protein JEY30_47270 [Bradyrhizobium japonicum]
MDEFMAMRQTPSGLAKPLSDVGPVDEARFRPRSGYWKRSSLGTLGPRRLFHFARPSGILSPLIVTIAILLAGSAVIWVLPGLIDSAEQRASSRAPVHTDRSSVKTPVVRVFTAPKTIVYRDPNGTLYRIIAEETEVDRFVNNTLIYLETEQSKIKAETQRKIDELLENAFSDGRSSITHYADWYFEWGRSWSFLKEAAVGGLKGLGVNNVQGFSEAARNEVEAYLIKNYQRFVLKAELRNPIIEAGISQILAQAHAHYLETLTTIDNRAQIFLNQYTRHLQVIDPLAKADIAIDWDAQKWKAPRYSADDEAFKAAFRGVAVSGLIAVTIGPTIERAIAQTFVAAAGRVVASLQPQIYGFVAGTVVEPGAGSLGGLLVGAAGALIFDYTFNCQRERLGRAEFEQVNAEALEVTKTELSRAFQRDLLAAVNAWFDDTRTIVAEQKLGKK